MHCGRKKEGFKGKMVTVAAVIAHGHVAVVYEQYENQRKPLSEKILNTVLKVAVNLTHNNR